eukprot:921626-Prorocentrum_minimum.AAC.1
MSPSTARTAAALREESSRLSSFSSPSSSRPSSARPSSAPLFYSPTRGRVCEACCPPADDQSDTIHQH